MAIAGNLLSANAESIETDASAWVAVINANSIARGTGGTSGSFCLSFKATAAGDCQVGLATRVAVTPGAQLVCYASVWAAVASGQSRVEIRWHDAGGALLSTTQGPLVTASAPSWNQNAAIGTVPASAATANVIIRVTGTAVNQNWFADRVFLGPTPAVSTGNLLDWETQDFEVDASKWTATNAVLSLQSAAATNFQALKMTSSAAGDAVAQTVATPAVTPGVEYIAYAYTNPGTAGLTARMQIQWRNAGGATLSTSSVNWTPSAAAWTRIAVITKAPTGAATARVAVVGAATAASQTWGVDRVVLAPTSALTMAGNLLPYNVADMEQDVSGWSITGGTTSQTTEQVLNGAYALKAVASGSGPMEISTVVPAGPVTPKIGYQFTPDVRLGAGVPVGATYQTKMDWLDAGGAVIRSRWQGWSTLSGSWLSGAMGDIAPASAVSVRLSVVVPSPTAGETWYMDLVTFREGGLTVQAEPAPGVGAALTVRGLTTAGPTWLWSLTRIVAGQAPQPVRGWAGDLTAQATTSDVFVITDYEAPLGVSVSWRIRSADPVPGGSLAYLSDELTLDAPELEVWLKDPGLPARAVMATVGPPLPSWTRAARQGVNAVRGRVRPVVISDVRSARSGQVVLVTETDAERDSLWWVLDAGGPLLLQWPPAWGIADMYVSVGDVTEAPLTDFAEHHDRTWTLPLIEVDRPLGGITGSASRTWQTVNDSGSSWSDALDGALTWLDVYTGETGS
ncbi:hypothetical protein ACQEVG_32700 [Streptomyces sp. CA-135486]|uniref:hypothetical protein n=1 Tax=Streptomyces sp. CA-135486 TaxID=3240049 RepID=UPI003D8DB3DF